MFWQVVLFILITLGVIVLRALNKACESEDVEMPILGLILAFGLLFFVPFAIGWGLDFIIGFTALSYWQIMGLYVLRNVVFGKLNEVN